MLHWICGAMLALTAVAATAAEPIAVENAWARATRPGQEVGAAYMELLSAKGARLLGVESPDAGAVEIHSMTMKDGVMEMRMLEQLPLPAGKPVKLAPGGFHLMLFDLKHPLREGSQITLSLSVEDADGRRQVIPLAVPVKAP